MLIQDDDVTVGSLVARLIELEKSGQGLDGEPRRDLEDQLVEKFTTSEEGMALAEVGACRFVMDFAVDYFGVTIATLDAEQLSEIMFEIVPRKVSVDASEASSIIEENRAFYSFLKRELGLKQADACLHVLSGDATQRLESALSDSTKFGMAKSLIMAGGEAGFDMSSKEGIDAWMQSIQGKPLPASIRLPSLAAAVGRDDGTPTPRSQSEKNRDKRRRQASRKARKKN